MDIVAVGQSSPKFQLVFRSWQSSIFILLVEVFVCNCNRKRHVNTHKTTTTPSFHDSTQSNTGRLLVVGREGTDFKKSGLHAQLLNRRPPQTQALNVLQYWRSERKHAQESSSDFAPKTSRFENTNYCTRNELRFA
jgi:hypothetical protein